MPCKIKPKIVDFDNCQMRMSENKRADRWQLKILYKMRPRKHKFSGDGKKSQRLLSMTGGGGIINKYLPLPGLPTDMKKSWA